MHRELKKLWISEKIAQKRYEICDGNKYKMIYIKKILRRLWYQEIFEKDFNKYVKIVEDNLNQVAIYFWIHIHISKENIEWFSSTNDL